MKLKEKILISVIALGFAFSLNGLVQPVDASSTGMQAVRRVASNNMIYSRANAWHNGPMVQVRVQAFFRNSAQNNAAHSHGGWTAWRSGSAVANSLQNLPPATHSVAAGQWQQRVPN